MPSTLFRGGTIWTGVNGQTTDALLVVDGVVQALGKAARAQMQGAEPVDLGGGFLMPSFGDGHAHPLPGGLEAVGPQVRRCKSVDEIVDEVRRFAAEHHGDEWIVGASYDSSLAPDGLFDARWLDAAVPDRPVALRAWDYHTMWVNSAALERAGITADTPDPVLGEIPHREDGSVLGTLREWGAVDLVTAVMPKHDEGVRVAALGTAADYYLARGVTWVQDAWVEPDDVDTYIAAARSNALRMRFNLALYADPRHFDSPAKLSAYRAVTDRARLTRFGGDCYCYTQLAMGLTDVVIETGLQPYDIQALIAVIDAAGGVVTDWHGGSCDQGGDVLACGDPSLHGMLLDVIRR